MAIKLNKVVSKPEKKQMLRELKKCALVCTTRVQLHNILRNFFRSCVVIVLVSTGTHIYCMFESFERALRWWEKKVLRCN